MLLNPTRIDLIVQSVLMDLLYVMEIVLIVQNVKIIVPKLQWIVPTVLNVQMKPNLNMDEVTVQNVLMELKLMQTDLIAYFVRMK